MLGPILFLTSLGALVGLIASILRRPPEERQHVIVCVLAGALGGLLGSMLSIATGSPDTPAYSAQSNALIFALFGALLLSILSSIMYDKYSGE